MRIEILLCLQRNFLFIFFHYILFVIAAAIGGHKPTRRMIYL